MVCDMETSEMLPHGTSATPKTNLSFILNPTLGNTSTLPHLYDIMKKVVKLEEMEEEEEEEGEEMEEYLVSPKQTIEYIMSSSEDLARLEQLDPRMDPNARVLGRKRPRRTNTCKEEGCNSAVVSRGRCVRHGGGSRCTFPGCSKGAKLYNRCFQHGGYKTCEMEGCTSKAKRYGFCWSHGGGQICQYPGCVKVSAQGGLCWAHGGGNRCRIEQCTRRSYQKFGYLCQRHHSTIGK